MKLNTITRRLGYILGAQWTRDFSWTVFTFLLARHSQETLGQIVLALSYGYLVKTVADVGLNDFLLSTFARREGHPRALLSEVSWLKLSMLLMALGVTWLYCSWENYTVELRLIVLCIAGGLGMDAISDSFFVLCQARGRQDVEMRIRIPSALIGIGYGIVCVILGASPLYIALYKLIESSLTFAFALYALGSNPLKRLKFEAMLDLARQMRGGIVFTCMAACAMTYNKLNVIFLKKYGCDADVGGYGIAWETIEGLSVLVSSALLGKVLFPMLAKYWKEDRIAFQKLSGQTAKALWAASLPVIFLICVESDRFLPFVYGENYANAVMAQRLLTPCLATAFLHNLAAYAMIGMRRHVLLFGFYASGLLVNIVCCYLLIPLMPMEGAALSLTITKVWVAILTVSFFQITAKPMMLMEWALMLVAAFASAMLWWTCNDLMLRECAELLGLIPLLLLFWKWRPPAPFERRA